MDHVFGSSARDRPQADRCSDQSRAEGTEMPLRITSRYSSRRQTRRERDGGSIMRSKQMKPVSDTSGKLTRRQFFQGTGALIVGFSAMGMGAVEAFSRPQGNVIPDYPILDLT